MKKGILITTIVLAFLTIATLAALTVENKVNSERDALMALYNSTNGPGWSNNTGWGTAEPNCNWYGVTCDSSGYVTVLDLGPIQYYGTNQLSGPIPPKLGNLSNLQELNLSYNQLSGAPRSVLV